MYKMDVNLGPVIYFCKKRYSMKNILSKGIIILLLLTIPFSCRNAAKHPPVNASKVNLALLRFDQELFRIPLNEDSIKADIPKFQARYGEFFDIFNRHVIQIGKPSDPQYSQLLLAYLTDHSIFELRTASDSLFRNFKPYQDQLTKAFQYFCYYFPGYPVPKVITFISGLNQSFVTADSVVGIGLDKFLGKNSILYQEAMLPMYQRRNMIPEKILPDCIRAWLLTELPLPDSADNLLDQLIYQGKIMYAAHCIVPEVNDTLLWGFTGRQYDWCEQNEHQMWTYLVEQKILFQTDAFSISKFINDGPFTKDFTQESPSRAAVWIGYRITEAYMKKHSGTSLVSLMKSINATALLEGSRYDP